MTGRLLIGTQLPAALEHSAKQKQWGQVCAFAFHLQQRLEKGLAATRCRQCSCQRVDDVPYCLCHMPGLVAYLDGDTTCDDHEVFLRGKHEKNMQASLLREA